jgi:hypothetical protein
MARIVVETLPPLTAEGCDAELERWNELGRRLRARDPRRFKRVLAIAAGYLSIYEHPGESEDAFQARLREAVRRGGGPS